ncbi:MAG: exodeoxyribonuclease VII large subunit [Candidatus Latescibacteria bacterium]|nr:exodeoxyribonuclease VII large subunit [Candidatus Latescibacterota bacterium]
MSTGELDHNRPFRVAEITDQIKETLEQGLPECWVEGEVSQYTHHTSGHRYFTLKDEASQLSCVLFKWQARNMDFEPQVGDQVAVYGRVSVYERGGRYQFYAAQLQPAGVGEMALAFERLKLRLEEEGLFEQSRKRALPAFPLTVGIVTSATGAAIRDIIQVMGRRAPGVQLILRPARVQGLGAADEIAQAIIDLNQHTDADILIVGRGGGAPEDLWCFNEEVVARAIYQSAKPVIAAVGHEVDYTIADYVADYRAPTPSAAAEVVVQEYGLLEDRVRDWRQRLAVALQGRLDACAQRLDNLDAQRLTRCLEDRLAQSDQFLDERRQALGSALAAYMRNRTEPLRTAAVRLQALSPLASLSRGFAVCQQLPEGQVVSDSRQLQPGQQVKMRFHHGEALCRVEELSDG